MFIQHFKLKFYEFLVCKIPNPDQAFACLDMTYISALLHHGFGLGLDTKLQVKNKIDLTRMFNLIPFIGLHWYLTAEEED
jgi:hypothetical protein